MTRALLIQHTALILIQHNKARVSSIHRQIVLHIWWCTRTHIDQIQTLQASYYWLELKFHDFCWDCMRIACSTTQHCACWSNNTTGKTNTAGCCTAYNKLHWVIKVCMSYCRMYVYFDDDVRQLQSLCYCNYYYYITTSIVVLKAYAYSHITQGEEMCEWFLLVCL
jgi:hypothetical protein